VRFISARCGFWLIISSEILLCSQTFNCNCYIFLLIIQSKQFHSILREESMPMNRPASNTGNLRQTNSFFNQYRISHPELFDEAGVPVTPPPQVVRLEVGHRRRVRRGEAGWRKRVERAESRWPVSPRYPRYR
jgi:hypothetical protein